MRDTVKPANGIAQDTIVITHCRNWRQWKSARKCLLSRYTGGNWAEDMAPQRCDQSAVPAYGQSAEWRPKRLLKRRHWAESV